MLYVKYEKNRLLGFRGDVVWKCWQTDGRTDDGRTTDGRRIPLYTKSSPMSLRLRWAKKRRKCDDVFFSIISLWDFFQTLKGGQLPSPWSDRAEFRTHSSSYVYHHYLQVWNEYNQKCSRKRDDAIFLTITLSVAMETSGRIWPNFKLIQALMHVLIIWKYEKDPIKNSWENVITSFSPL